MRNKVLALILAGGAGSRMDLLTEVRAKPTLPYGGMYQLIDFPLSNCVHSGITDVWVIEQFQTYSLNEHLVNGRPWDLDRTFGGLRILPPYQGTTDGGWHHGNADAIYRNSRFIREFGPDIVLVLSADHVYKLDYQQVIDQHMARRADVTMVTTRVPSEEANRFGTVRVADDGKVTAFDYKPDKPSSDIVTTEVFVYNAPLLLATIEQLASQSNQQDDETSSLKDFGNELLPTLVQQANAYAYPLDGYWRDVGTLESYWQSHMDLLEPTPPIDLDQANWPIRSTGVQRLPARILDTARIENSLISVGCQIRGRVARSVLGPGVVVEEDAVVEDTIIFHDTFIGGGAHVRQAIVDSEVRVDEHAQIGQIETGTDEELRITLVGQRAHIRSGTRIPAGGRVKLGKT